MEARVWHRHYDKSVPVEVAFEDVTLPGILERSAARWGDRPAVLFMNCALTYRELAQEVDRLATALAGLGVVPDSRVAIHLPNLPQVVIATMAALKLGAQVVMTNPLYVAREIEYQWQDAGVTVAVTGDWLYEDKLAPIRHTLPVQHYIVASIPEYLRFPLRQLAPLKLKKSRPPLIARVAPGPGIHLFRPLIRATAPSPPPVAFGLDHVAFLQYTGGTTGVSKGAMITHRNMSHNLQQLQAWFPNLDLGHEVILGALPFFHIFGLNISMLFPQLIGGATVLMPNPRDIPQLVKNITRYGVTLLPAVPAHFNAINQFPGVERLNLTSVKRCFSGSAPLPVEVLQKFEKLTGAIIVEGFGMTETCPVTHCNPLLGVRKIGTVGLPVSSTDALIVDAEDGTTALLPGQEGELIVKGPQVMPGYWNKPAETAQVLKDGWMYTGDLAVMDEDGYFKIVGRKKDMIKASGFMIFPDEIDAILMGHPKVLEACTIGIPDQKRGETVKSFLVLKPGQTASADEIQAYCKEYLAPYKVPRMIEFRPELPKSAMMKLLRRVLRDEEETKLRRAQETGAPQ
ncbi:MAG: long-chain fatty acid--CoA ligase [Planctomycetota bacterium]|nr:MAG: long-chain fatty acid--CoA ligase [Planctomycetota bacterium]